MYMINMYMIRIADHLWLSVELNRSNIKEKFKEFISRDYSKFQIDKFLYTMEKGLEQRDDLKVNERAEKFVQNMVAALDYCSTKEKV